MTLLWVFFPPPIRRNNSCGFDAHKTEHMQVGLRLQPDRILESKTGKII